MAKEDSQDRSDGKGKAFFERGDQVAETGNWDFAIQMYLEGIQREPDNVDQGHKPLREVSLKRTAQGGKPAGMIEKMKRSRAKTPEDALVNAEFLLAKEPGSLQNMILLHSAATKCEAKTTLNWITGIMLEAQQVSSKRSLNVLRLITETFAELEEYIKASQACEMAILLSPNDGALRSTLKDLAAKHTMQVGKYGEEGEFTKGVKDMKKQQDLIQKDAMVQQESYLRQLADEAVKAYEETPTQPGKIMGAAKALLALEHETDENIAIDILAKAHRDLGAYQFKMQIGDVKIRQLTRQFRKLKEAGDTRGATEQLKKILAFELKEYAERAENYPTDLAIRFELARRQLQAGQFDDAIGSFQHAQRDPRRHVQALVYLGQTFAKKEMFKEAADTYRKALESDLIESRAKDVRYNYGDVLEKMGDLEAAEGEFSTVAQIDFSYKDVRDRLQTVRNALNAQKSEA